LRELNQSLPLKLLKAREAVMDEFRPVLNANGVTEQQWRVIRALVEAEAMDAGQLARAVNLRMPSLSRIIRDLDERGIISKARSPTDRRLVNVTLTDDGRALFEAIAPRQEKRYKAIEERVGPAFYRSLMADLDKLIDSLRVAE